MAAPVAPNEVCPKVPETLPQFAVPLGAQVALPFSVTPAGSVSLTVTPAAEDGPPLVTVTM